MFCDCSLSAVQQLQWIHADWRTLTQSIDVSDFYDCTAEPFALWRRTTVNNTSKLTENEHMQLPQ